MRGSPRVSAQPAIRMMRELVISKAGHFGGVAEAGRVLRSIFRAQKIRRVILDDAETDPAQWQALEAEEQHVGRGADEILPGENGIMP